MSALPGLELSVVAPEEIRGAAGLGARGMADNPTSIALFGSDRARRIRGLEPVFGLVLLAVPRSIVCVRRNGHITGIAAMAPPGKCLFKEAAAHALTLGLAGKQVEVASVPSVPRQLWLPLLRLGLAGRARVSSMSEVHFKHDPLEPHYHVELVVVDSPLQGLGIGGIMMEELCRQIDREPAPAWLETDTEADVRFYRRYGFEVADEATVLGARNWYMRRD